MALLRFRFLLARQRWSWSVWACAIRRFCARSYRSQVSVHHLFDWNFLWFRNFHGSTVNSIHESTTVAAIFTMHTSRALSITFYEQVFQPNWKSVCVLFFNIKCCISISSTLAFCSVFIHSFRFKDWVVCRFQLVPMSLPHSVICAAYMILFFITVVMWSCTFIGSAELLFSILILSFTFTTISLAHTHRNQNTIRLLPIVLYSIAFRRFRAQF